MPPLTDFLTGNTSLICLQHIFNSMIVFLVYIVFLNGMLFVTMCSTWLILAFTFFTITGMQIWFQNMFKTYILQIYWISFCVLIIIRLSTSMHADWKWMDLMKIFIDASMRHLLTRSSTCPPPNLMLSWACLCVSVDASRPLMARMTSPLWSSPSAGLFENTCQLINPLWNFLLMRQLSVTTRN